MRQCLDQPAVLVKAVPVRSPSAIRVRFALGQGRGADAVSGATVTVVAESQTLTETARAIAEDVGVIRVTARVPGTSSMPALSNSTPAAAR